MTLTIHRRAVRKRGKGIGTFINKAIDKLPIELHIPGYQFCGPGTKLRQRLARGDRGVNPLDKACREHDIAYSLYKDNEGRRKADAKLASQAWSRVTSHDANILERAAALGVGGVMKLKSKIGGQIKNKTSRLNRIIKNENRIRDKVHQTRKNKQKPQVRNDDIHPTSNKTSEVALQQEIKNARKNIREKMKALQHMEGDRTRMLDIYVKEPVERAMKSERQQNVSVKSEPNVKSESITSPEPLQHEDMQASEPDYNISHLFKTEDEDEDDEANTSLEHDHLLSPWSETLMDVVKGRSDTQYGPYFMDSKLYLGNAVMHLNDDGSFVIRRETYHATPGLKELIFEKNPNMGEVTPMDKEAYKHILMITSAHKNNHAESGRMRFTHTDKYKIIKSLFIPSTRSTSKKGSGLRFTSFPKYKYWRDPNTLVKRLHLLRSSQSAGHGGHQGEIVEIENELRQAGLIA